ncbi:biopolymer transporter ExbD [Aeoliella sp. ICT_H6.2]|uniref:Biopolymer transporter ExbD n=1 Tax=Aeoliella straminimaris TaxID=2954799 RepID=A0A9X2JJF4_9BACT|nr:biopolymer transporter ExbD [Aeoliella straminimaris]MCO6047816.1 biopolymer transporter ExbD [Aeoliella straminimaris]
MPVQIKKGLSGSSLSLTPLIDVVFLLLIFFLVTTRFEEEERDMAVNLPKASAAEPTIFPGKEIFVTITPTGEYFLDGKQYSASSLENELKSLYENNPGKQRVKIRADEESRTTHLVTVMNACNQANIRDYTIATE